MDKFPIYTIETAPKASKPALRDLQAAFGVIPNIAGAMATSPVSINSLVGLFGRVHGGSFSEARDGIRDACPAATRAVPVIGRAIKLL